MTSSGGSGGGVIFKTDASGNNQTVEYNFSTTENGYRPTGSLIEASDGKLYGMTSLGELEGLTEGYGVIFKYDPNNIPNYTTLHNFDRINEGAYPWGSLIEASDGNLYGMTMHGVGGEDDKGVIFKYNINTFTDTTLYEFNGTDGAYPIGSLIEVSDGVFYGMTSKGGVNDSGVIFKYDINESVPYTKLYDFNRTNGGEPQGSLVKGFDGKLYGMTLYGGANNKGVIFKYDISDSVPYTKLYDFNGTDGAYPYGSLIETSVGNFYGMTTYGGVNDSGVVFKYNISDTVPYTKLYNFGGIYGGYPFGSLFLSSNGKLYGMTYKGGENEMGVLFECDLSGNYAKKLDFNSFNGAAPQYTSLIEVNPCPANAGADQTMCLGSSTTLTSDSATSYTWSTNDSTQSINVSPTETTTYTITVNNDGCTASDNVVVTVENPIVNAGIVYFANGVPIVDETSPKTVSRECTISISTTNTNCTYSWSTGATTQTTNVFSSTTGTYTYTLTITENGCTDIDTIVLNRINPISGNCSATSPFVTNITSTSAKIHWNNVNYATSYMVRYRLTSEADIYFHYFNASSLDSIWDLTGFISDTTYVFQIRTFCDGGYCSIFTPLDTFRTLPACPIPTGLHAYNIDTTIATLSWDNVSGAYYYGARWRALGSASWKYSAAIFYPIDTLVIGCYYCDSINKLLPNTSYEWQLQTFCDTTGNYYSMYSVSDTFTTLPAKKNYNSNIIAKNNQNSFSCNLYPNPTNSNSTVDLSIPQDSYIDIELYDIFGSKIANIYKGNSAKGSYKYTINTQGLKPSTYIIRVVANNNIYHKQLILIE